MRYTQLSLCDAPVATRAHRSLYSRLHMFGSTPPRLWHAGHRFLYPDFSGQWYTVCRNEGGFILTVEGRVFDVRPSEVS